MSDPNTMTACENLCRDFYWFWSMEPRVLQGILTVCAALIGSITALFIAIRVYPLQKAEDRKNETSREQRAAVASLIAPIEECKGKIEDSVSVFSQTVPDLSDPIIGIRKATSLVRVYGANDVADRADDVRYEICSVISILTEEKALRPPGHEKKRLKKRPPKYIEAQEKRFEALKKLNKSLDQFFSACSGVLGVSMKNIAIDENQKEDG